MSFTNGCVLLLYPLNKNEPVASCWLANPSACSFIWSNSIAIASRSEAPNTSLDACIINSFALIIMVVRFCKLASIVFKRVSELFTFFIYWSNCSLTTLKPESSTEPTGSSDATKIFFPLEILPCIVCKSFCCFHITLSCS